MTKRSLTIGNFDGVHLGHRLLIERVCKLANHGETPSVLTFEPHPRELLGIRPIPTRLCSLEEKKRRINSLGIQEIVIQEFDEKFSNLSAEDFLNWIENTLTPSHVVVGNNFFFGKNRTGTHDFLLKWGLKKKIHIEVLSPMTHDNAIVSSSEIRTQIQNGDIKLANKLCGFDFSLPMQAEAGDARGRNLGFPTINSQAPIYSALATYCLPPHGVYITRTRIEGLSLPSITNFGTRPTFHNAKEGEFFETHILSGWEDRLSSKHLSVDFIDRIRPEQRFSSKDELIQRIQEDILIAKTLHKL